jgi:PAS domain S-box-containing protein
MIQKEPAHTSLETYELILQSMKSYAVFAVDINGIIKTWNTGAEKLFYYSPEEIIGRNVDILYTPEDIAAQIPAAEASTALIYGKGVNERFHVKKDRSRFWGSGLLFPLYNKDKEHIGFTKVMQKVSDEQQAQANLREEKLLAETWVSTFNERVVILNPELKVINATASFIAYFALDSHIIDGINFFQIMPVGLDLVQLRASIDAALKANNFHNTFEVAYSHPQLGQRTLLVKPRRIYQPPNILFSLEFVDLTEEKSIMQEKDVFISIASHEIRTPISVIKAYGQILGRELKEAKPIIKSAVQKINEQINSMNLLINALLDTTKLTTGKLVLDPEVFNLSTLVHEIAESFRLTQTSHEIIIENDVDSIVFADKIRTGTVVTNLVSNAIKYSPAANQVIINIDQLNHHVRVSVQDFGLGIAEAEQGKLFQRFGRTESIRKTRIPGTGLGLHLASEIIKMQGGEISFTTEEGKGSSFFFTLPLY